MILEVGGPLLSPPSLHGLRHSMHSQQQRFQKALQLRHKALQMPRSTFDPNSGIWFEKLNFVAGRGLIWLIVYGVWTRVKISDVHGRHDS